MGLKKTEWLLVGVGFLLLTLFVVWPLPLHLTTHVIGWPGDNFYFVWLIEWYARTLLQGRNPQGVSPWDWPPAGYVCI